MWLVYTADLCDLGAAAAAPFCFGRSSRTEDLRDRAVEKQADGQLLEDLEVDLVVDNVRIKIGSLSSSIHFQTVQYLVNWPYCANRCTHPVS